MNNINKIIELAEGLQPKLESGEAISNDDILTCAAHYATREGTYFLLLEFGKQHLFSKQYFSIEKMAETNLAHWLNDERELNAYPDSMEYVKRVTICDEEENENLHYEVFRFKTNAPHWAAENGWMIGVVGLYLDDSEPDQFPEATFSRLQKENETTAEDEAKWVHENIYLPLLDQEEE